MKLFIAAVLAALSVELAALLYGGQPAYLAAFALSGLIIAAYIGLMAQLTGNGMSLSGFLVTWAIAIVLVLSGEGLVRAHSAVSKGLFPAVVSAYQQWKEGDKPLGPLVSTAPSRRTSDVPPSPIDNVILRQHLDDLISSASCNDTDLGIVWETLSTKRINVPGKLQTVQDVNQDSQTLHLLDANQAVFSKILDAELDNDRHTLKEGTHILAQASGPHASTAMQTFMSAQGELISSDEEKSQLLKPLYPLLKQIIALELAVKMQGHVTSDDRKRWSEYVSQLQPYVQRHFQEDIAGANGMSADARTKLTRLLGKQRDRYAPYPLYRCNNATVNFDKGAEAVDQITSRWKSDPPTTQAR